MRKTGNVFIVIAATLFFPVLLLAQLIEINE